VESKRPPASPSNSRRDGSVNRCTRGPPRCPEIVRGRKLNVGSRPKVGSSPAPVAHGAAAYLHLALPSLRVGDEQLGRRTALAVQRHSAGDDQPHFRVGLSHGPGRSIATAQRHLGRRPDDPPPTPSSSPLASRARAPWQLALTGA